MIIERVNNLAKKIKLLILDVDGVLTNGELFTFSDGEYKSFYSRDGLGIVLLMKSGIEIAIISGGSSSSAENRLKKLGIKLIYQGVENKAIVYKEILQNLQLSNDRVAYMGDDLIDLPVMQLVGLPTAVADADVFVKKHAKWVSKYNGGRGAVRELCELILESQGKLEKLRQEFIN